MGFKIKMPKISLPKISTPKIALDNKSLGNAWNNYVGQLGGAAVAATGVTDPLKIQQKATPGMDFTPTGNAELDKMLAYRAQREADLVKGRERGDQIFTEGVLGRVDPMILEARKQQAQQGFTTDEQSAMRAQNQMVNQQLRGDQRSQRIAMAAEGVRGGRAAALQSKMLSEQGAQKAGLERDLFLKGIDSRRQGLSDLDAAQRFNIEQKNKELQGRLTTELGYGSLGVADRGAAIQSVVGSQQAQAAARAGSGGGKK